MRNASSIIIILLFRCSIILIAIFLLSVWSLYLLKQYLLLVTDRAVENEVEQLKASVDFLVELCETSFPTGVCGTTLTAFHKSINLFLMSICWLPLLLSSWTRTFYRPRKVISKNCRTNPPILFLVRWISQFFYFKVDNTIFPKGKFANFLKLS